MKTLTAWSWRSYMKVREQSSQLREYQVKLSQTLKSLDLAYHQLEKTNEKLMLSKAIAEEARRAKAEFAANVSHELRTPINMITGFTEMILRAPRTYARRGLPPALLADLEVVLRNAQHLSDLINDILDLSQLDAGRMGLTKEWASIREVVCSAVETIKPLADTRGLPVHLEMDEELPAIFMDVTRVRQVLLNLLSNALRFTEEGYLRVQVRRDCDYVVISVSDTGPGIAPEDIPKLFQPFRQLDGSTRRRYGGTGLGLNISRNFVTLHGGDMRVESQVGEGTTVYFSLPVDDTLRPPALLSREEYNQPAQTKNGLAYVVVEPGNMIQGLLQRYTERSATVRFKFFYSIYEDLV